MRQCERALPDAEFPSRYALDEARFPSGHDRIINKEDQGHEPTARISQ